MRKNNRPDVTAGRVRHAHKCIRVSIPEERKGETNFMMFKMQLEHTPVKRNSLSLPKKVSANPVTDAASMLCTTKTK